MAEEAAAVTTDPAGINRTSDGQIAPAPEASNQNTTQTQTTEKPSLLNEKSAEAAETKAAEGAPETYSDYKLPDGYTLDPALKTETDTLFKGMGLSQENAQKLVDFYVKSTTDAFQEPFTAYQTMLNEWRETAMSHPDLRGKLGPGQEINTRIGKALDSIGDPALAQEFREVMDLTGAGNHPAFIRVINAWARQVTEGSHVSGNGPSPAGQSRSDQAPPSAAQAMWPTLPSQTRQ